MNSKLENIFLKSPYFIRLLGANFMSWRLNRTRRGRVMQEYRQKHDLQKYFDCSWEAIHAQQNELFVDFIRQARCFVPFYQKHFAHPPPIESIEQITTLPTLSKEQARNTGNALFEPKLLQKPHYTGHTSGSTGTPFVFKWTFDALRTRFALRDNFYQLHGYDNRERSLRLGGRLFMDVSIKTPPFWLMDYVTNQLMFSLYHLSDKNLEPFMPTLLRIQPKIVTGYPSACTLLARYCKKHNVPFYPKAVFTDSETLLDHQRETIETVWQCPVFDYYGLEVGVVGMEWGGQYRTLPLTSVVEILDEKGNPIRDDRVGQVVVTDLTNPLMPLIRYETGDMAVWSANDQNSNWNTPAIARIEGRQDDIVILPDGRKIGRLDHIFKQAKHIRECQIIQETRTNFMFLLVPDVNFSHEDEQALLHEAYKRLGSDIQITVKKVTNIPRTKAQKLRSVISHVERD